MLLYILYEILYHQRLANSKTHNEILKNRKVRQPVCHIFKLTVLVWQCLNRRILAPLFFL